MSDPAAREPAALTGRPTAPSLETLLAQLAQLVAAALAPQVAAALTSQAGQATGPAAPSRRLVTLEELIELLPAGRKPKTWRSWLYQRSRLGQIPGCHKLGGRLFFDPDVTLAWLAQGARTTAPQNGQTGPRLDLPGQQSDHPPPPRQGGRQGGQQEGR
jgi:hypothetical protein